MGVESEHIFFLERKFPHRDPSPAAIRELGATGVIAWQANFDGERLNDFRDEGLTIDVAVAGFEKGICPVSPDSRERLQVVTHDAIQAQPRTIFYDYFRFDGDWESFRGGSLSNTHSPCEHCHGVDRAEAIAELAQQMCNLVVSDIQLGYFDVPFHPNDTPEIGQDPRLLSDFLTISPMLYHDMICKTVTYVHKYLTWLRKEAPRAEIVPILQVKTMPDDLPDQLQQDEIQESYVAASALSPRVAWFSWDALEEKGKQDIFRQLFIPRQAWNPKQHKRT